MTVSLFFLKDLYVKPSMSVEKSIANTTEP